MRSSALLASGLALFTVVNARIEGFYAPSQVAPDSNVRILISGANYIQSIQDVSMVFGISSYPFPGSLGQLLSQKDLGPDFSNQIANFTHIVHIPATYAQGSATLTASLFQLLGAGLNPDIDNFQLNVTVGESTNADYVFSSRVDG